MRKAVERLETRLELVALTGVEDLLQPARELLELLRDAAALHEAEVLAQHGLRWLALSAWFATVVFCIVCFCVLS